MSDSLPIRITALAAQHIRTARVWWRDNRTAAPTDEQINELVIADVNDPSAWGDPIVVGPSKGPRRMKHAKHLELASKFYVLSVLHRLGADATMTFSHVYEAEA